MFVTISIDCVPRVGPRYPANIAPVSGGRAGDGTGRAGWWAMGRAMVGGEAATGPGEWGGQTNGRVGKRASVGQTGGGGQINNVCQHEATM